MEVAGPPSYAQAAMQRERALNIGAGEILNTGCLANAFSICVPAKHLDADADRTRGVCVCVLVLVSCGEGRGRVQHC